MIVLSFDIISITVFKYCIDLYIRAYVSTCEKNIKIFFLQYNLYTYEYCCFALMNSK